MINKFITDKTKIYLAYKVDGHIYRDRSIDREREVQFMYIGGKYNIYLHEP
jgi:hypothetical protein